MTERRNTFSWSIAGAVVFFVILWLLDFPKPMIDDLFYTGAGLNLASGGDFSNPLLVRQQFPSHYFLMYPPVHPHLLAGWLKVFGASAATMTSFALFAYLIAAIATILVLRKYRAPAWLEWLVPLGVSSAFLNIGFRPEPVAVALIMAGFALVEVAGGKVIACFAGFFLLCLGISTAPRTALFGIVLLFAGLRLWRDAAGPGLRRGITAACALGGLLTAVLVFLWMIDYRLGEFLTNFHYNSQNRTGEKLVLLMRFLQQIIGITQWPALALLVALCGASIRCPIDHPARIGLCLTAMFPCIALIGGLGHGSISFAMLGVLLLIASLWQWTTSHHQRIVLCTLVCATFGVANSRHLVNIFGIAGGKIQSEAAASRAEALVMRPTPEHPLLLDASVARYVFDYRIPAGCVDWSFAAPFPADGVTDAPLRPGDVFLIGPASVDMLTEKGYVNQPAPKWFPPGLRRWAFDQFPRRAYVIRAADCKEPGR